MIYAKSIRKLILLTIYTVIAVACISCDPWNLEKKEFPICNKPEITVFALPNTNTLSVSFSISNEKGPIKRALWDFGDGVTLAQLNAGTHSYAASGTYQVKLQIWNACDESTTYNINVTVISLPIVCETGTTTLEAVTSGGIQSFIYTWQKNNETAVVSSNGIIKINEEGNYRLLVTDGIGCSVSSEMISVKKILNPATPNIVAQGLTEICSGSTVTLTTDAKETSYQWLKNEIPINDAIGQSYKAESSGIYKVQVLNSTGCSSTSVQSITINEVVVPQPFIKQSNDTLISSYLNENKWFFNGSQLTENSYKIKFITTGNYQVKAVLKGCESVTSPIFNPIILANENSIANVSIYPNPVSNNLVISSLELVKYKFFDTLGRVLKEEQSYNTQFDIDVSTLNDGEYLLLLQGINQKEYSRKIVIRK